MNGKYIKKFALTYTRCFHCQFVYETTVGEFDNRHDAITLAEGLHKDNFPKCKKRQLAIYVSEYYREEK